MKQKTDVPQGTLALMVLKTLDVLGPPHGCLHHQEPSEMILFLLLQRRVLIDAWFHCGFRPWLAKIFFEACRDIRF